MKNLKDLPLRSRIAVRLLTFGIAAFDAMHRALCTLGFHDFQEHPGEVDEMRRNPVILRQEYLCQREHCRKKRVYLRDTDGRVACEIVFYRRENEA